MIEIDVTFDDEGNSSAKVKNMSGKSCLKATQFIEQSLGIKVADKKHQEFYKEEKATIKKWI